MTQSIRFFMSLSPEIMSDIDRVVEAINYTKSRPSSNTNRQAVVRALISFALQQDIRYKSTWDKFVTVSLKP